MRYICHMLTLPALPAPLEWLNAPAAFANDAQQFTLTAGGLTDWFIDPSGATAKMNAPAALFAPPDDAFVLSARITVAFSSTYDAGVLALYERDDCWAKLCFEYSPQRQPMVVSVVTRGASDDCNSTVIDGHAVWLRLYRNGPALALHYSQDGAYWHFVRHFTLGALARPRIGFLAQSPTGSSCTATFDSIAYRSGTLVDLRSGE
jgi:uncharacterized protein